MDAFLEEIKRYTCAICGAATLLNRACREQAGREARFSRQGQFSSVLFAGREVLFKSAGNEHGRSATAMAAYEGQSGSKDRGDLEVRSTDLRL
jgi:hypothetical protein